MRYKNQDLFLEKFEDKTGNIISIVFYSLFILITLPLFFSAKIKKRSILFLLIFSLTGLLSLIVSDFIELKESKIIFVSAFIIINLILISSLLSMLFTGFNEIKFFKTILIFVFILITGIGTVFFLILNFNDDHLKYESGNQKASSGIILGAAVWGGNRPSPVLKERINKGYEIYSRNYVPKLVITGGGSPNELTEGEVSKNVLIQYGVDPANLILENSSSSTIEQIHFVRDSLYKSRNWKNVILVSDNFHLYRARQICDFNNIDSDCIASDKELSSAGTISFCMKESLALIIFWVSGV